MWPYGSGHPPESDGYGTRRNTPVKKPGLAVKLNYVSALKVGPFNQS